MINQAWQNELVTQVGWLGLKIWQMSEVHHMCIWGFIIDILKLDSLKIKEIKVPGVLIGGKGAKIKKEDEYSAICSQGVMLSWLKNGGQGIQNWLRTPHKRSCIAKKTHHDIIQTLRDDILKSGILHDNHMGVGKSVQ